MSFVFRGVRPDIESGFSEYFPERHAVSYHRLYGGRPINSSSLAFLVTVLVLFTVLNSLQMSPNFLLWLVLGIFLMATSLKMFATCQQLQAQARARAATASGLRSHSDLRMHVPPSIALATRGRLQGLRLQLALLDREFDDLAADYETLRTLDTENASGTASMSEEEINALPAHKYKVTAFQGEGSSLLQLSSSSASHETNNDPKKEETNQKTLEDELTCTICLEQVNMGELVRSLPCLHQFHAKCIDPWLGQQGTCPVCKLAVGSGWLDSRYSET